MKKILAMTAVCILLLTMTTGALANQWGLRGGVLDIIYDDDAYDDYNADADNGNKKVGGRNVNQAILSNRYHSQLICAVREDDNWVAEAVSTVAVYQPGDDRAVRPELRHLAGGGISLSYGGKEVYVFARHDGEYCLQRVLFDESSSYGDSLMWTGSDYSYFQAGQQNSRQPIGDALWKTDMLTLAEFNITQLPRSMADVRRMNTVTEALMRSGGRLNVQETWPGEKKARKLAVFTAPDEDSYRASNGKASVSTGGEIRLLGEISGWTMIEYEVSLRTSRIGFVPASLMQVPTPVPAAAEPVALVTARDTFLTDDPHVSQYGQAALPAGTKVQGLALCGSFYALVSYEGAGRSFWGFVPLRDLALAGDQTRWDVMDLMIGKWSLKSGNSPLTGFLVLSSDGTMKCVQRDESGIWLTQTDARWRVTNCPLDAAYQNYPLYEMTVTQEDGSVIRFGLSLDEDGSIRFATEEDAAIYERQEYSTIGNG